jgi:hypothetical protein
MSYNGSGTFNINTAGQPVVTGTVISSSTFNALTADLGTGLSTALTKDGQTVATARIPFAQGINSSLVTDATSTTTGSIITAGGVGIAKALYVGTTANIAGTTTLAGVTATSITDSGLTSGRVTYAGTSGLLQDSANLTFNGTTLTANTIGAFTLGGTVAGGGNQLNNVIIGTTTPLAGAFTTLSASSSANSTVTTGVFENTSTGTSAINRFRLNGGTSSAFFEVQGSGFSGTNITNGPTTSALAIWTGTNIPVSIGVNASEIGRFSSTGLAVTGTLSATGLITGSDAGLNVLQGALKAATASGDGITLGYSTSIDAYDVGVNYSNVNGTESVNAASRASWRTRAIDAAATPSYVIGYRAPNAGAGVFTNYMTLDSSGNLLVGTTSSVVGGRIAGSVSGTGVVLETNGASGYYPAWFQVAGAQKGYITTATGGTTYNTTSDYRLKENIQPMTGALAKVAQLKPCTYVWKETGDSGQGFIAHELAEIVPECVTGEKDGTFENGDPLYQGIDTSNLVATLTAAIQEQQAIITALTTRITALEAK